MFERLAKLFKRPAPTPEEKRQQFAVDLIYEHTKDVLSSLARPHENDWTPATRATVFGYVLGSTFEYRYLEGDARKQVVLDVLQRFGDTKLDPAAFNAELDGYMGEGGKYFELGIEAARYDNKAGREGDIVYAFLEAVRYPDETTFNTEEPVTAESVRARKPLRTSCKTSSPVG